MSPSVFFDDNNMPFGIDIINIMWILPWNYLNNIQFIRASICFAYDYYYSCYTYKQLFSCYTSNKSTTLFNYLLSPNCALLVQEPTDPSPAEGKRSSDSFYHLNDAYSWCYLMNCLITYLTFTSVSKGKYAEPVYPSAVVLIQVRGCGILPGSRAVGSVEGVEGN